MHQSMRKSFRDASEMCRKSAESDMQGCTLTALSITFWRFKLFNNIYISYVGSTGLQAKLSPAYWEGGGASNPALWLSLNTQHRAAHVRYLSGGKRSSKWKKGEGMLGYSPIPLYPNSIYMIVLNVLHSYIVQEGN